MIYPVLEMSKPDKCFFPYCENCLYEDCRYSELEYIDIVRQNKFDDSLKVLEPEVLKIKEKQKKYEASQKGKERRNRYKRSQKGIEANKRYDRSEKRKEANRRYYQSKKMKSRIT